MPQENPQHVPVEASETLAFTPDCLKSIKGAPSFTLRAATSREERFVRRLSREEGIGRHDLSAIRAEMLAGLRALWTPEVYAEKSPVITEYWDACDQHSQTVADLVKQEPDIAPDDARLVFDYDKDIEAGVAELLNRVEEAWAPLRRMYADNAEFDEMSLIILVAVMVEDWTGLPTKRDLDRGYITVDCVDAIKRDLHAFAKKHGASGGLAFTQLAIECGRRMRLDEEEAGNSASPSPSSESPEPSSKSTQASNGKSQASASSSKTPEPA